MSENEPNEIDTTSEEFTKAVDAAVEKVAAKIRAEERRKVSEKYADYDDLKAKAEGAKSLEDRLAEIEKQSKAAEERALRAEVATAKGLTANQAKRLIGTTREELEADADELLQDIETRESERKKNGNHVPREGRNPKPGKDDPLREYARGLFDRAKEA